MLPSITRIIIVSLATVFAATTAANAQQWTSINNKEGLIKTFSVESMGSVLNEAGASWETNFTSDDKAYILLTTDNGLKISLLPAACSDTSCVGVNITAYFTNDNATSIKIAEFNEKYAFTKAVKTTDGFGVTRYDISDYGMTRGNFAMTLLVFDDIAGRAPDFFNPQ